MAIESKFNFLKPAKNQTAYMKAGMLGFAGSGKTYTASEIAIGLCALTKNNRAAFFDTETGSDFMIPKFSEAGIDLMVFKGRAFTDLLAVVAEAEREKVGVLIIDSISHVWRDLMDSYVKKLRRKNGLYFQDWSAIKGEWQQFSDLYVNSKLHIIMCGRAGYEYDMEKNEETGRNELVKSGTKMKVESELGFEPSLLLEMERIRKPDGIGWINRAVILKDRTDTMNGRQLDYPKFKDFSPIVNFLNIGGEHHGVDTTRNSEDLFDNPDYSVVERKRRHAIALEQLQEVLILNGLNGVSEEAKRKRTELLIEIFGTSSKTAIEGLNLDHLNRGIEKIKNKFNPHELEIEKIEDVSKKDTANGVA